MENNRIIQRENIKKNGIAFIEKEEPMKEIEQ
jgi:hypothetical protein